MKQRLIGLSFLGAFVLLLVMISCLPARAADTRPDEGVAPEASSEVKVPILEASLDTAMISDVGISPKVKEPEVEVLSDSDDPFDDENKALSKAVPDPIRPLNEAVFYGNDFVYDWSLFPVADGYGEIAPDEVKNVIENLFHNLNAPVRIVNCVLQGKWEKAGHNTLALVTNTLLGVGLTRVYESEVKFDTKPEDFSQTLASYGVENGMYVVLPWFGPSTIRNMVGSVGDALLSPQTYLGFPGTVLAHLGEMVNKYGTPARDDYRPLREHMEFYDTVKDAYSRSKDNMAKR